MAWFDFFTNLFKRRPHRPPPPPIVTMHAVGVEVRDNTDKTVPQATVLLDAQPPITGQTNAAGYIEFAQVPTAIQQTRLTVTADGFEDYVKDVTLVPRAQIVRVGGKPGGADDIVLSPLKRKGPPARAGRVRADVHVAVDDTGPFLALGTTLFWALWGWRNDRPRVERHLQWFREHGVDYVRILGTVSWEGRQIPAHDMVTLEDFVHTAYTRYGMRTQVTVFGDTKTAPTLHDRSAMVEGVCDVALSQPNAMFGIEISNEGYANGPDIKEARSLAATALHRTHGLVAVTAPRTDSEDAIKEYAAGNVASMVTLHYARDLKADGLWRPVRQPWRESKFHINGVPDFYSNNEPIGPASSANADPDPWRLAVGAAVSWLCGNGAHVFHTGHGVFGRDDPSRGRRANVYDASEADVALRRIQTIRGLLNPALPNWTKHNGHWASAPMKTDNLNNLVRAYHATWHENFVSIPFGIKHPVRLTGARPADLRIAYPDGRVDQAHTTALTVSDPAVVIVGRFV